jgi:hypothetical protein
MEGQDVVTPDDHKLGTVIAERDDCVIIEMGHLFKAKHAVPRSFLHEHDGVLRATVAKEVISDSPKVELEDWDCGPVNEHYGLVEPVAVDPDPDGVENAETVGTRAGVQPAPAERLATLGGANDPSVEGAAKVDRLDSTADRADAMGSLGKTSPDRV